MSDLGDKCFRIAIIINMFKEIENTLLNALTEAVMIMSH